jgi:hypothetical protein
MILPIEEISALRIMESYAAELGTNIGKTIYLFAG